MKPGGGREWERGSTRGERGALGGREKLQGEKGEALFLWGVVPAPGTSEGSVELQIPEEHLPHSPAISPACSCIRDSMGPSTAWGRAQTNARARKRTRMKMTNILVWNNYNVCVEGQ